MRIRTPFTWSKVFFSLSLFLITNTNCPKAHAHAGMEFARSVYTALDLLESTEYDKFRKANQYLLHAEEFIANKEAREPLLSAIKILQKNKNAVTDIPSTGDLTQVRTFLANALVANRTQLNSSYLEESKLFESLLKVRFFKENYGKVRVTYENIPREKAISLLLAYLVDPRAAKYDPQVAALVTGRNSDGSPTNTKVIFALEPELVEAPGTSNENDLGRLAQELQKDSQTLFGETPIRPRLKMVDPGHALVWLEVVGMENASLLEFTLRDLGGLSHGNRYLEKFGRALEAVGAAAQNPYSTGISSTTLTKLGEVTQTGAQLIRNTIAKGLPERSYSELLTVYQKRIAQRIANATSQFDVVNEETLSRIKKAINLEWKPLTGSDLKVPSLEKATEFLKANQENIQIWKELVKNSNGSPQDLMKAEVGLLRYEFYETLRKTNGVFERLVDPTKAAGNPRLEKLAKQYAAARAAGATGVMQDIEREAFAMAKGSPVWGWDSWVRVYTYALTAYHVFHGFSQITRASDAQVKEKLLFTHIPKVINDIVFLTPHGIEFAVAYDFGGLILGKGLKTLFSLDLALPSLEETIRFGFKQTWETLLYRVRGTSSFEVLKQNYLGLLGAPPIYKQKDVYLTHDLVVYKNAKEKHPSGSAELLVAEEELRKSIGLTATRYAALCYLLTDQAQGRHEKVLGKFEADLFDEFFNDPKSVMKTTLNLLGKKEAQAQTTPNPSSSTSSIP